VNNVPSGQRATLSPFLQERSAESRFWQGIVADGA